MSQPLHITDENFEAEVLNSDKPVLVDFWATWCGPCRMIAPIIEDLAKDYEGKAVIGKLDVDNNQQAAEKFGIRSIPTILIFKGGQLVDTIIGAVGKPYITERLEAHMN
jgi:thioredoxin 1